MLSHFIWDDRVCNSRCVNSHGVLVEENNACSHFVKYTQTYRNIADVRYVFKDAWFVRKYNGGDNSNHRVFCAAYLNFPMKLAAAFYNKLFQSIFSPVSAQRADRFILKQNGYPVNYNILNNARSYVFSQYYYYTIFRSKIKALSDNFYYIFLADE